MEKEQTHQFQFLLVILQNLFGLLISIGYKSPRFCVYHVAQSFAVRLLSFLQQNC